MPIRLASHLSGRCLVGVAALAVLTAAPLTAQDPGDVLSQLKVSDTAGGFTGTLDNSDTFGSGVSALGDFDGNGMLDLVVGADHDDDRDPQSGAVWVLRRALGGGVLSYQKISDTEGGFLGELEPNDLFGSSVAVLGYVDGDDVVDIAVGARADDDGSPQAGAVWILFLNDDGTVKSHAKINAASVAEPALGSDDEFGTSVAALGDIDGDGVPDLAVGGPRDDHAASQAGAVWTVRLTDTGGVKGSQKITTGVGGFGDALVSNAAFGTSLATLGDLSGDGTTELAVGSTGSLGSKGAVWILSLDDDGFVVGHTQIGAGVGGFSSLLDVGEDFGAGLAGLGDLDGDGVADLAVGQPGNDDGGAPTGALWLLFLTDLGGVKAESMIGPGIGGFTGALDDGDAFGSSLAALAPAAPGVELTLAVGSTRDDDGGPNHGAVWLLTLQGPPAVEEPDLPLPFPEVAGNIDGVAGRPALILNPVVGPGDELTEEPLTITPRSDSATVASTAAQDDAFGEIDFAQTKDWITGGKPIQGQSTDLTGGFTGDGGVATLDVVTANEGGDSFSVLIGNDGGAGGGTVGFDSHVEYMLPFDGAPQSIATGDFDGDTDPDVVVAGDQGVSVFLNDGLFTGTFTFASFTPVPLLTDVITGYVDGDGNLDVLAASGAVAPSAASQVGFVTILRGQGDGTLSSLGTFADGRAVASVLLGDFDHAGGLDALVSSHSVDDGAGGVPQGSIALYLGDGLGGFTPSVAPWSLGTELLGAGYDVPHPDGIHPRFGALADMDDDGWLDAVYTSADNIAFAPGTFEAEQPPVVLTVLLNDQSGGFDVHPLGTPYVGRGVTPLLADFFVVPGSEGGSYPDCILVFHQDTLAGVAGGGTGAGAQTFLAPFVGDGTGLLVDASPNQFLSGNVPGDPITADVDPLSTADGSPLGLDVVVPNMNDNSISILFGDGTGAIVEKRTVEDVDDLDPGTLPIGGFWVGGPRSVRSVRLFGDDLLDIVAYNRWDDLLGGFASVASVSIFVGDGKGNFVKSQYLPLPGCGEFTLIEIDGDAKADLAVTSRDGVGSDELLIYQGTGTGVVSTVPIVHAAPAGYELTGGLENRDVEDDLDGDLVTTALGPSALDGSPDTGQVLIWRNTAGVLVPELHDLGASWTEIRSVDVADMTDDLVKDVVVGAANGELFFALGQLGGTWVPQATNPSAAAAGGGALRVADLNGDRDLDLVSSTINDGTLDQAFVRVLLGAGNAAWAVKAMQGLSSVGPGGSLRPATGDMNGDGATDVILAHGFAGTVSIVLNKLSTFESFDAGKAGSSGIQPLLNGKGYTTPGGKVDLFINGGLGGASGLLQIGVGQAPGPVFAVQTVLLEALIQLDGAPGVPGAGKLELNGHMPNQAVLVGTTIVLQAILVDPAAPGPPAQGFSLTNGLSLTIVQ